MAHQSHNWLPHEAVAWAYIIVICGQLAHIGPSITQLAAARGCCMGLYYRNIWAISSHGPIKHPRGCRTRLSHGPIAYIVAFGQLPCIGPSSTWHTMGCPTETVTWAHIIIIFGHISSHWSTSTQWAAERDCRMGPSITPLTATQDCCLGPNKFTASGVAAEVGLRRPCR